MKTWFPDHDESSCFAHDQRDPASAGAEGVRPPERTVADWIAEGETTIALFCIAKKCGHHAAADITRLPPETKRSQIVRRARCTAYDSRDVKLMRDMDAHYRRMLEECGFDPTPRPA